ncbi:ATP-binding protein [Desulfobacterales bacterium HSG16]|nr:ATP-binding protein [Desulfobacterales bacterium HSG16]
MDRILKIEVSLDPKLPIILADSRKCKQVMLNLLSNALKYTPNEGMIKVSAKLEKNSYIRIEVSDTGIGIEDHEIDNIFSEFHQADRIRDQQLGGTGIGLALTRRLVELHGGEIGVKSIHGKGSVFWFTLIAKKYSVIEPSEEQEETVLKKNVIGVHRILVVEDNDVNLAMILDMLSIQKHNIAVARNGLEAIEIAQSFEPELILMDIRMPVMGGLEATKRLRNIPGFADTPIIALTASTGSDAEDQQIAAGCIEHLAKPIQSKELFAALNRHL